jgi:hypothetical protein
MLLASSGTEVAMNGLTLRILGMATGAAMFLAIGAAGCKSEPASKCVTNGTVVEISGNHGHTANVPAADVKRGIGGTYPLAKGTADHAHVFVLKDSDMQKLQKGETVTTRSSSVNGHVHELAIRCKD